MRHILAFVLLFNALPGVCYQEVQTVRIIGGSPLGNLVRAGINMRNKKKMREYIKTCHRPDLELLDPQEAMRIIVDKNIRCSGVTKKTK